VSQDHDPIALASEAVSPLRGWVSSHLTQGFADGISGKRAEALRNRRGYLISPTLSPKDGEKGGAPQLEEFVAKGRATRPPQVCKLAAKGRRVSGAVPYCVAP